MFFGANPLEIFIPISQVRSNLVGQRFCTGADRGLRKQNADLRDSQARAPWLVFETERQRRTAAREKRTAVGSPPRAPSLKKGQQLDESL